MPQFSPGVLAEILFDQSRCETVESGRYRRVRGEEIPGPGDGQRCFESLTGLLP